MKNDTFSCFFFSLSLTCSFGNVPEQFNLTSNHLNTSLTEIILKDFETCLLCSPVECTVDEVLTAAAVADVEKLWRGRGNSNFNTLSFQLFRS